MCKHNDETKKLKKEKEKKIFIHNILYALYQILLNSTNGQGKIDKNKKRIFTQWGKMC